MSIFDKKPKYYRLDNILKKEAQYNIIFGERSNGKTFAVLEHGLKIFAETGKQLAIIRRWKEDFRGKRGQSIFDAINDSGLVEKYTHGEYTHITYYSSRWFLSNWDEKLNKYVYDASRPFAFGFALSEMEHDKSTSYPNITTIMFDEFLTRGFYIPDEFVIFMNVISTIVRQRKDAVIFMLGNTVNKYCPYFAEMGLTNIPNMKQGKIDVYTYGESDLKVAVEFADNLNKSKESDFYFAFDNPKLKMITTGTWELDIYPHLPYKYLPKQVIFTYFIVFDDNILQCEVIETGKECFTYIHRKTTPIKNEDRDLIYTVDYYSSKPNIKRNILKPATPYEKKITAFFLNNKVFYQNNEVGEIVRNYTNVAQKERIV